jgi:type III pantothenate kinase
MNLYVDVGNSRIKWKHDGMSLARVANNFESLAAQWRELEDLNIKLAAGCCVRGSSSTDKIDRLAQEIFANKIDWQKSVTQACGVTNAYTEPEQLGVDRWVALIAARARYPNQSCIVVDAGTAITVDLVDASGQHRGGVILPGAKSMFDTLDRAEQLFPGTDRNLHELAKSAHGLTRNTQDAMLAGIIFAMQGGVSSVIEQQIKQIKAKIETTPIILTGGDSTMLKLDSLHTILVPDLVLEGLQLLNEKTR